MIVARRYRSGKGRVSSKIVDLSRMGPILTGASVRIALCKAPHIKACATAEMNVEKANATRLVGRVSHGMYDRFKRDNSQPWPRKFEVRSRASMIVDGELFAGRRCRTSGPFANVQSRVRTATTSMKSYMETNVSLTSRKV